MIGIFDSGIGGLTAVKEVLKQLPEYQIIYFGDTARTPYGNKSSETIKKYAFQDTDFLIKKGAKLIIVACNTASALGFQDLKDKFNLPIFEVITPAVEKAVLISKNKRIGVIGTRTTIESGIYQNLIKKIDSKIEVFSQACPLLVPLIEENWPKKPEMKMIVKKYLYPLKLKQIDTLILGCTHYPIIKDLIQIKMGQRVKLVDSAEEIVIKVKKFLEENKEMEKELAKGSQHQFFLSDITAKAQEVGSKWLESKVKFQLANFE
jgi:glutamate racemase